MKVLIQFDKKPLLFRDPVYVISCEEPSSFDACFGKIEDAIERGYYLAGFISYEAGYCFEESLAGPAKRDFPLMRMGVYDSPIAVSPPPAPKHPRISLKDMRLNIPYDDYFLNIGSIREYIENGDVYQVTYCVKFLFTFRGDPFSLYNVLLREQPVPYPAYIESGGFHILSLSPEMFLRKMSSRIMTKPMKGTWPRGGNIISDAVAGIRFKYDKKNRAENVMIADLLRNDLGRMGTGIKAPKLFEVTKYRKLHQMTSTITGELDARIPVREIFASLFPSGSVTGAPKIRAMRIIRELEREDRRIYTGAIGYITPERDMYFNIPIRTLLIREGAGEMGVGGGIVWDSTPRGEWEEGLLKAKFLTDYARNML
ncbi:MAG: chorismate-binding protein [Candidatus Omnitrophota bacterium]